MKRRDSLTPLLPGFLEYIETAGGLTKVQVKETISTAEAAKVMGMSPSSAKRMGEAGAIFARRKTHLNNSHWKFCGRCCEAWAKLMTPCADHRTPESRAVQLPG